MNIFQKILFPFSGPKTKFLENKWWHRLAQVVMTTILIVVCIIMYFEVSDRIDYIRTPEGRYIEDINNAIGDFGATVIEKPNVTIEYLQSVFPEFENLDKQVFVDLKQTISNNQNITIEEINSQFPMLREGGSSLSSHAIYYLEYIFEILGLILLRVLLIYVIFLGLQLVYFKGIVYIIYGNKGK